MLDAIPIGRSEHQENMPSSKAPRENKRPNKRPPRGALQACPFCRELFTPDEGDTCPHCDVDLRPLESLPLSPEAELLIAEEAAGARTVGPAIQESETLSWKDMSRGRGVLLVCALIGIAAFFLPWAVQTFPEAATYSAMELARAKGFFWASLAAWIVLIPAVLSRRTVLKMLGARIACIFLCAAPGIQCAFLLSRPTKLYYRTVAFEHHWGAGVYLTLTISIIATLASFRFGGKQANVIHEHPKKS